MAEPTLLALVVQQAAKRFGDVPALAGASFEVRRGELVGLLGPNGAGKTTLIRAIAGRLRLDAGTIALFGRMLTPDDPRPEVGVVPQEMAIYPRLTARENLEAFGALYGVARAQLAARVDWALTWADLADRAKEPVKRFSGGMKRRLNIACSLLHSPRLVLLDEPTVGVDPQSRERIYEMLAALQRDRVSIVLTTHHLEEAEQRCERIVIIDHGKSVAEGTLPQLVGRTLGEARSVRVSLAAPWPDAVTAPAGLTIDDDRRAMRATIHDVGRELPALIQDVAARGGEIADVSLAGARLQDVFIALTGRELRE